MYPIKFQETKLKKKKKNKKKNNLKLEEKQVSYSCQKPPKQKIEWNIEYAGRKKWRNLELYIKQIILEK